MDDKLINKFDSLTPRFDDLMGKGSNGHIENNTEENKELKENLEFSNTKRDCTIKDKDIDEYLNKLNDFEKRLKEKYDLK